MQRDLSAILIAFAAGIVVAGGGAYIVSHHRHEAQDQRLQQQAVAKLKEQALPDADTTPGPAAAPEPAASKEPVTEAPEQAAPPARSRSMKPSPYRRGSSDIAENAYPKGTDTKPSTATKAVVSAPVTTAQNELPAVSQPAQSQTPAVSAVNQSHPEQPLNPPVGATTAAPEPRVPKAVTLASGTPVTVRLNETLSTDRNAGGDTFTATLDRAIVVDGFVIADRGARVLGKIIKAERAGRVKGVSELELALTQVHTTDDQTVNIDTTPWMQRGEQANKKRAAEVAGGAALGAIIGAIAGGGTGAAIGAGTGGAAGGGVVLAQGGKQTTVPAETRVTFTLQAPVTITERLN